MNWLLHTVLGGSLLLWVGWRWMQRVASPARRQHLGKAAVLAALVVALLSLAPAWLQLPVLAPSEASPASNEDPAESSPPPSAVAEAPRRPAVADPRPELPEVPDLLMEGPPANPIEGPPAAPAAERAPAMATPAPQVCAPAPPAVTPGTPWTTWVYRIVLGTYVGVATVLLGRWLLGMVALQRLLRRCWPASGPAVDLFAEMAGPVRPRLLVSPDVRVPFSCGAWRPTVVLPAGLAEAAPEGVLRWVFAHELDHLTRRDARGTLLFSLGQAVYFYLPWFWWLRRQVYLCQEYLADAAAARTGAPLDYAEFLAGWAAAPALPAGVTGVSGSSSDLLRRITMLVQTRAPLEPKCSRGWSLWTVAALLSVAVLAAGIGATAAPVEKKEPPKKGALKKVEPKKAVAEEDEDLPGMPDVEKILKDLPQGLSDKEIEHIKKELDKARDQIKEAMKKVPRGGLGLPKGLDDEELDRIKKEVDKARDKVKEAMKKVPHGAALGGMPGFAGAWGHGPARLGVRVEPPSETLAEQLDLPADQGMVVEEVMPKSPAEKAGIKAHDILLELNGKPVPRSAEALAKLVSGIKADKEFDAAVLRKGRRETIKGLKLSEAPRGGGFGVGAGAGVGKFPGTLPGGGGGGAVLGPGLPGVAMATASGGGVMTTLFRTNDRFTLRHQEGSLVITVTGSVADGKSKVGEVRVQDGHESHKYSSVEKVSEAYRDKVKNLVEMAEKSNVKIDVHDK
jgi:beta-lactamase regulating signal transducer with metallopeptidase domain